MGDWKYREVKAGGANGITGGGAAARELFNLAWDPSERTNVIEDYPEKAAELSEMPSAAAANGLISNGSSIGRAK